MLEYVFYTMLYLTKQGFLYKSARTGRARGSWAHHFLPAVKRSNREEGRVLRGKRRCGSGALGGRGIVRAGWGCGSGVRDRLIVRKLLPPLFPYLLLFLAV